MDGPRYMLIQHRRIKVILGLLSLLLLASCGGQNNNPLAEIMQRDVLFPDYPKGGWTYLSFSQAHGFQVNYLSADGKAWLWYPGNTKAVSEEWKRKRVSGQEAVCWRHPSNSYNPVLKKRGGSFACELLSISQRTIVARLKGDTFKLSSGKVPYRLNRCSAPDDFMFDRSMIKCR